MSGITLDTAHRQWAHRPSDQRFKTLAELTQAVMDRRDRSKAVDVDTAKTEIKSMNDILTINGTIEPAEPSHWAFGQIASEIGAPAGYLRTLPNDLVIQNVNHGLKAAGHPVKFMTIAADEPEKPNTLQAVTSTTYGRIWDADVAGAAKKIVDAAAEKGSKFFNPKAYGHRGQPDGFKTIDTSVIEPAGLYASDRDIFIFMIDGGSYLDAGPRAQLNRGFIMWNSEVGSRTAGLMTFYHNGCCGNNYLYGVTGLLRMEVRHTSGGPAKFDREATPKLLDFVNESMRPMETAIKKAQDYLLPKVGDKLEFSDVLEYANKHGKFSKAEITQAIRYATSEEGDCRTLWHLTQGLTAYARGLEYVDTRLDLEARAGKLLNVLN